MPNDDVIPNSFDLEGPDTHITYATSGLPNGPMLAFTHSGQLRTFSAEDITGVHTALGDEITVILKVEPDRELDTLTLALPSVLLPSGHEQTLTTFAVITTNQTPQVPPPGPAQLYEVVQLSGRAQFVKSVGERDPGAPAGVAADARTRTCWHCHGMGSVWKTEWVQEFKDGTWITVAKRVWETCDACGGSGEL